MKPLHENVLVRPEEKPKKVGNIHIPEIAQDSLHTSVGVVVEIGPGIPGKPKEMAELKKGMRVIYASHSGRKITLDGVTYHMMAASEILAEAGTDSPDPAP